MACFRLSEVSCSYFVPYFRLMLAVPICALFEIVSGQLLLIVPYLRLCKVGFLFVPYLRLSIVGCSCLCPVSGCLGLVVFSWLVLDV